MDEDSFEGTLVLEKLAEIGEVESFFDAVDSDDLARAKALLKRAKLDPETIKIVLQKILDSED